MRGPERAHGSRVAPRVAAMLAALALLLLSPLFLLIAAAIVAENRGPVFFSQARLGQHGTPFRLYKFRKFYADGRGSGGALTLSNDRRLTRVGRFLERTKLDELPQLWNILRGEMALVGPRPESLHFADCFDGPFLEVLDYRPGLFGPSQTLFRNESAMYPNMCDPELFYRTTLFPAKARIDLAYYRSRSAAGDVKWLLRSILATCSGLRVAASTQARDAAAQARKTVPVTPS